MTDGKRWTRRRTFLAALGGVAAAGEIASPAVAAPATPVTLPFYGAHQNGIVTPLQSHSYFAALDLVTADRNDVVSLLRTWTAAAARMTEGKTAQQLDGDFKPVAGDAYAAPIGSYGAAKSDAAVPGADQTLGQPPSGLDANHEAGPSAMAADTGETLGLLPARLTVTFGFGAGLFSKDGVDRYGLASRRPEALVDLPKFVGDQLVEGNTGGDLCLQACADDPQVAFHAVRQLARLAGGAAKIRWAQTGFVPNYGKDETPRNLMGFRDGTNNPSIDDPESSSKFVWVGAEGPAWMRGGTYMVARRIRMALENWDRMKVAFQEETFGRHKYSGAPIGKKGEFEALDLEAIDTNGNPAIAENAHVRLAAAANNDGVQILRRGYSYNDGVNFTTERWPPWRQGLEYDAGLFFVCYQRDPRTGFIKIFERMAKFDMLNQFVTHVGGGLFACPPGAAVNSYIGQALFETG